MGTFMGHVLPGGFFICFGLHWLIQVWRRYFLARFNQRKFHCTATYPFSCCCGRFKSYQWEGVVKILVCAIGLVGELATGIRNGKFVIIGNGQHSTMYSAFILNGVVDIMIHHKVSVVCKNLDYLSAALAFLIECVLFKFHLHGRSDLDVQIHTLLVYTVVLNVICVVMEMRYQSSILAGLARPYFVMLQGTWFCQVALILYNPIPGAKPWDGENHENMMITTIFYGWHMLLLFIFTLLVGFLVKCACGKKELNSADELDMQSLIGIQGNGHTLLKMDCETDDSDFEDQKSTTLKNDP